MTILSTFVIYTVYLSHHGEGASAPLDPTKPSCNRNMYKHYYYKNSKYHDISLYAHFRSPILIKSILIELSLPMQMSST
jgi:hypothetical protein